MYQSLIIQCIRCGSPYKVYSKFKFCQCTTCPWVMVEKEKYTYGVIRKNLDIPFAQFTRELYEEVSPGNYRVLRDEDKKKKDKKKRRFIRKLPSQMFDYGNLVIEYENKKKGFINSANTI